MGGDAQGNTAERVIIPVRYFYDEPWPGSEYTTDRLPSDMYYACLEGSMDANGNGIFGEPSDGTDLLPELLVGRAPVSTHNEVSNFVMKNLIYRATQHSYLLNTYQIGEYLGYGGDTEFSKTSLEEIKLGSNAHGIWTDGFREKSHLSLNTLYDSDYYSAGQTEWPIATLKGVINDGVHIINHLGHGYVSFGLGMSASEIDLLANRRYFFTYSQACLHGAFDYDCAVEHFVKGKSGAFAFIANSRYGWAMEYSTSGPSQFYAREFWDAVFGEGIKSLGGAHMDAKWDNFRYISYSCRRWCHLELNLFGDPELELKVDLTDLDPTAQTTGGSVSDPDTSGTASETGQPGAVEAEFTAFPRQGSSPLIVSFADRSQGNIMSWEWDFGDGIISSKQNTWHIYRVPGRYTVSLTVINSEGNRSDREVKTDYIVITSNPHTTGMTGESTDGYVYTEPDVDEPGHATDMDFGLDANTASPGSSGGGGQSEATLEDPVQVTQDTVEPEPQAEPYTEPQAEPYTEPQAYLDAPVADFSFNVTQSGLPTVVQFTDNSQGDITDREWTFGDGGTSRDRSPLHTYRFEGIFTVRLKVTGPGGEDIEEKIDIINVNYDEPPVASFITSQREGNAPLRVYFADTSTGDITSWRWGFGDGIESTLQNVYHEYTRPGAYTVVLNVRGPAGNDVEVRRDYILVSESSGVPSPAATDKSVISITIPLIPSDLLS